MIFFLNKWLILNFYRPKSKWKIIWNKQCFLVNILIRVQKKLYFSGFYKLQLSCNLFDLIWICFTICFPDFAHKHFMRKNMPEVVPTVSSSVECVNIRWPIIKLWRCICKFQAYASKVYQVYIYIYLFMLGEFPDWKKLHWPSVTLTPLGIMGDRLTAPLNPTVR